MGKTDYIIPTDPDHLYYRECDKDIKSLTVDYTANHKVRNKRSDSDLVIYYGIVASAN
jgi:hypothetical protein